MHGLLCSNLTCSGQTKKLKSLPSLIGNPLSATVILHRTLHSRLLTKNKPRATLFLHPPSHLKLATSTQTGNDANATLKFTIVAHIDINIIKISSLAITKMTPEEIGDSPK